MSGAVHSNRAHWIAAGLAAAAVMAALLFLFRFPKTSDFGASATVTSTAASRPRSNLQMTRTSAADSVLKEETEIRDLRPLFLPTEFNVALPEPRREAGRTFLDNETLKWEFAEAELKITRELPAIVTFNGKPADKAAPIDVIGVGDGELGLTGFGREKMAIEPLAPYGGQVEVVAAATGHRVFSATLPPEARAPGSKAWEPLELLAVVDAAGLTVPLVVTTSSRVEEVDTHYRSHLSSTYRIGDRLPPGVYRIVVAP